MFQKRPGSRKKVFEEEEKPYLHPLPRTRYQLTEWKTAKVQPNYHIQVERMQYSVPYEYVREQVDIRLTPDLLEFYFKEVRIASHKRLKGEIGQFSTHTEHMPDHHRLYLDHNPENNRIWSESIGPYMKKFVHLILEEHAEKKALSILSSLRNTAEKHEKETLETTAETLLTISSNPTVSVFKSILDRKTKRIPTESSSDKSRKMTENYGFVRGASYFRKGHVK
jgi:hypothetical protein